QIASRRFLPRASIRRVLLSVSQLLATTASVEILAGEEELVARLGCGDRRGCHQLRDLADGLSVPRWRVVRWRIPGSSNARLPIRCDARRVRIRCVIVDDNEGFIEVARGLLGREGLCVEGVASMAADALRQAEALRPDVVLVDVFLGEESGLELARRLVEGRSPDGRTVILISTHSEDDVADLIAGIPAAGFLPKVELSAEAIRRIVDRRSA